MNYKPTLVLMAGLPGAGKTTLATELGRVLHWTILDKDLLKLSLLNQELDISSEKVGESAYELLFAMAEDILVRQQISIILDTSARYPFILERAIRITGAAGAEMKIIHCFAPSNIRLERLKERAATNLHYPFMVPMATTTIEDESLHFRHLPVDRFRIDTRKPIETCLEECLQYIQQTEGMLIS